MGDFVCRHKNTPALSAATSPSCLQCAVCPGRFCHFGTLAVSPVVLLCEDAPLREPTLSPCPFVLRMAAQPRCLHALFSWTAVPDEFSLTIQRPASQMPYQAPALFLVQAEVSVLHLAVSCLCAQCH